MATSSHPYTHWPTTPQVGKRDSKPAAGRKSRPLFGNQLRWAKSVIEDALAQRRAAKR